MDNDKLLEWWHNKSKNPLTKRTIKSSGKLWKNLLKLSLLKNIMNDIYHKYHGNKIDPIMNIPITTYFTYPYCWDPLNGQILGKDARGKLYFDPNFLIHYFYTNRLNHLWIDEKDGYTGTYGEGLGNGPDFYVNGRGKSPQWYLFRLPLHNAYCDLNKIGSRITLAPTLSYNDIVKIKKLSNEKKYKKYFGSKLPNLIELYNVYHQAIQKPILDNYNQDFDIELVKEQYIYLNIQALNKLKNI